MVFVSFVFHSAALRLCDFAPLRETMPLPPPASQTTCSTPLPAKFLIRGKKSLAIEPPLLYISIYYKNRERPRTRRPLFENSLFAFIRIHSRLYVRPCRSWLRRPLQSGLCFICGRWPWDKTDKTQIVLSHRVLDLFEISRVGRASAMTKPPSFASRIDFRETWTKSQIRLAGPRWSAAVTSVCLPGFLAS